MNQFNTKLSYLFVNKVDVACNGELIIVIRYFHNFPITFHKFISVLNLCFFLFIDRHIAHSK